MECVRIIKTNQFNLYKEVIAVFFKIHTKHVTDFVGNFSEFYL